MICDGKIGSNIYYYGAVDNASGTVAIVEIALNEYGTEKWNKTKRTIISPAEGRTLGSHFNRNLLYQSETWVEY